jgi:sterol desaturase/sphingolipid hydroxylase (fatty acid hydroxylase superfamily)
MDDLAFGTRNKRGDWRPNKPIEYPAVFVWPVKPMAILRWVPEYVSPYNLLYALLAVAVWLWLTPPLETMQTFGLGWILFILARNLALTLVFYSIFHVRLYRQRKQGTSFKFNGRWLEKGNNAFYFSDQLRDNLLWTLGSGVPFWTAYEVLTLWMFANGYIPFLNIVEHPIYFVALMFVIPLIREFHFYCVHRLIHWPPLYRTVHHLHHANTNPGPWSGLSMHPVEHLLYFSGVLIHWIVPSHPMHALFHLVHAGLSPAPGHTGFEKIVTGKERAVDTHAFAHYLHHKYFECNYADGTLPLDKWFGSFHDGTDEAHEAMNRRFLERHARKSGQQ